MTSQHLVCNINIQHQHAFFLVTITIVNKKLQLLADKLTLKKTSSELNKLVEPALSIGCRKLPNIGDFCISINTKSLFSHKRIFKAFIFIIF